MRHWPYTQVAKQSKLTNFTITINKINHKRAGRWLVD